MPHATSTQAILLVEDSPEDYQTTLRAFRKTALHNPIFHCANGEDALDFLYQRGAYCDPHKAPRPCLIILDLNLPGTDGREILKEIKQDDELRKIPVVMLTTSSNPHDIEACYAAGANSYLQKPVNFEGFLHTVQCFKDYWFEAILLPEGKCQ